MINIAFNYIDGSAWRGGYNYLLNLVGALSKFSSDRVQPIIFVGTDINSNDLVPFEGIKRVKVVKNKIFNTKRNRIRLFKAIVTGSDQEALAVFSENEIDIVFESALFYGWRFPLPTLTWIPDFQHRHLKKLFGWKAFWKREIGFRMQTLSGRHIMLSSNDARRDCEKYYPITRNNTSVVHFSVPAPLLSSIKKASEITKLYGLPNHFFLLPNQFWAHKNHICVINALSNLKERGINLVIACSGQQSDDRDPYYFKRIQNLICDNGLKDNLRLLGMIPSAHISILMMECSALINPSTFEGWSTTVEEAKAIGVPMILSKIRVHEEQTSNAIFFEPHSSDQLANILENFIPSSLSERDKKREEALKIASLNLQKFADIFTNLITLQFQAQRRS